MPNWTEVLEKIKSNPNQLDNLRNGYIQDLSKHTGRNTIAYYSGWLQKSGSKNSSIEDADKNGLMAVIHKMDRSKGLDLILHTPGGNLTATESIVHYLRCMFGNDIRAIIPQLAMSAGTMVACSCREIIMGKQSNIGPIDPQFGGIPAHGVVAEFKKACLETKKDPSTIPMWKLIISKYHPTFLGDCEHSIQLSTDIVSDWLKSNMFEGIDDQDTIIASILDELNNHADTKEHSRHIHFDKARSIGLNIKLLEDDFDDDGKMQDLVLTIHHAYMHTFAMTGAVKIIENQLGGCYVIQVPGQQVNRVPPVRQQMNLMPQVREQ